MKVMIIELLIFISFHIKINAFSCTTPLNEDGNCIPLLECRSLLDSIRNSISSDQIRKFVRNHQCATSPRVMFCCTKKTHQQALNNAIKLPKAKDGVCGRSPVTENLPSRIVGGEKAYLGEFPWSALIVYAKPNNKSGSHCGGSLITHQHVLTSAHCVDSRSIPPTWKVEVVRLGEFDLENDPDCDQIDDVSYCAPSPIDIAPAEIFIHERYEPSYQGNPHDIAIIRLSLSVDFTEYIKPVCLPIANEDNINIDYGTVTVAGFGRTETRGYSTIQLKADVDIVERNACTAQYRSQGRQIQKTQLCAMRLNTDSCDGDSGNALVKQQDVTKINFQIGIVSYGPRKCGKVFPAIYINVIEFIDWIKNKVET